MKRLICLLLVIALLAVPSATFAASGIWFIAVDDTIPLTLTGSQLPFYSGGSLYVPCNAFDSDALSVFYKYDSSTGIFSMYNNDNRLIFDLETGNVLLKDGTEKEVAALSKNGVIFIPVYYVASSFGIGCAELEASGGYPMIRLTTGNEIYDNDKFVTQSKNLVDDRVNQYLSTVQTPEPTPTPTVTPTPTPTASPSTTPVVTQPPKNEPEEPPAPEIVTGVDCALFLDGCSFPELKALLDGTPAVFTFTPDSLVGADEAVRAIITAGYDIALVLDLSDTATALSTLASCNDSLRRMAMYKSMMVIAPEGNVSSEAVSQLKDIGCQVWTNLVTADSSLDLTAYEEPIAVYCPVIDADSLKYFIKAAERLGSSFLEVDYSTSPLDTPKTKEG